MAALAGPDRNRVGGGAERIDPDVGSFRLERARDGAVATDGDFLLGGVLDAAFGAVERNLVAFPGVEGVERVTQVAPVSYFTMTFIVSSMSISGLKTQRSRKYPSCCS